MMYYTTILKRKKNISVYVAGFVSRDSKTLEFDTRTLWGYIKGGTGERLKCSISGGGFNE